MKIFVLLLTITMLTNCKTKQTPDAKDIQLPHVFGDNMVLQQNQSNNIWGTSSPNGVMKIKFANKEIHVQSDAEGQWDAKLPALKAGGPYELIIIGHDTVQIQNILIGEVWLASGQSNMGYTMKSLGDHYLDDIKNSQNDKIRFLTVEKINSYTIKNDMETTGWKRTNPTSILKYSAAAYFFAKELHQEKGVPVGIINSSYGGTAIERWISRDTLETFPRYQKRFANLDTITETAEMIDKLKKEWIEEMNKNYSYNKIEENKWKTIHAPETFEHNAYPETDGFFWLKKTIHLPEEYAGKEITLHLAAIDDLDFTYFNDTYIGYDGPWHKMRIYNVPRNLVKQGQNEIVIGVMDFASNGGFHGEPEDLKIVQDDNNLSLANEWKCIHVAKNEDVPPIPMSKLKNSPSGLYNAMIAPIIPYSIKGVIWYQGESNVSRAKEYSELFPALITNWRKKYNNLRLPFIFVQLANFKPRVSEPTESDWAELREAQTSALELNNTAMAVTIDIGEAKDIHPKNKKEVGKRLFKAAQKIAYNQEMVYSGPIYDTLKIKQNKVYISFKHSGSALTTPKECPLKGFAIAGQDSIFYWADESLIINDSTVMISSSKVPNPLFVRYGWADNPDCNLYNKEGLPASPFRSGI